MAAPTLVACNATSYTATTISQSTSTFTWLTGDVFVVIATAESGNHISSNDPTATGLTFTFVNEVADASMCSVDYWHATAGSSGSGAVSLSYLNLAGAAEWGMTVWQFRGSDGVGAYTIQGGTNNGNTVSLTRTQADSMVVGTLSDWNAVSTSGYVWTPTVAHDRQHSQAASHYSYYVADWGDQGVTGTTSYGITGVTGTHMSAIAVEVKGSAASGVSANLPVTDVAVAAKTPTLSASLTLSAAGVTETALAPSPKLSVALTAAQVDVSAPAPTQKLSIGLAVAQETVSAPAPTTGISVDLTVAQVSIAAPTPLAEVGASPASADLTTAEVDASAQAPSVKLSVTLPVSNVSIQTGLGYYIGVRVPLHLGGTADNDNDLGGTASFVDPGLGGTTTVASVDGTASVVGVGGTLDDWTMQAQNITLGEFNDCQVSCSITSGGSAKDITGYTVEAYFKTAAGVSDGDDSTIKISGTGITIDDAATGSVTVNVPASDLANGNIKFWRLDIIDSGNKRNTAIYGTVTITLL